MRRGHSDFHEIGLIIPNGRPDSLLITVKLVVIVEKTENVSLVVPSLEAVNRYVIQYMLMESFLT